jgi:H+/Cl- antiporter ClcA
VLIPVAGAAITGFLLHRYFPEARGSGIPQTKTALFLRDGYIGFRTVLGKFGLCSASLATGIALGREGPSVHVGAGIASELGRRLHLSAAATRALIPIGAAAALAAAFNTPISAVLFSLEEVMGDMHAPVSMSPFGNQPGLPLLLVGDAHDPRHRNDEHDPEGTGEVSGAIVLAFARLQHFPHKHLTL